MNMYELAKKLNGREYLKEITKDEEMESRKLGFVVVFGHSDDYTYFKGAIYDEVPSWEGAVIVLNKYGVIPNRDGIHGRITRENSRIIEALWEKENNYSWTYKTEISHATFNIYKDNKIYCKGIVFNKKDLPNTQF